MQTRRHLIKWCAGTLVGMGASGLIGTRAIPSVLAQATPGDAPAITVTITAMEFAFEAPTQVPAGLTSIMMNNVGGAVHMAQIGRLNDDVTFDEFRNVLETGPQGSAIPLFTFRGGPTNVAPGASQEVINLLDAGHYVMICFVADPDGVQHFMKGMLAQFEVTGTAAASPEPAADLTISMLDFAYEVPDQISSGRHTWSVVNDGQAPHEVEIMKLEPGVTEQEAVAAFMEMTMPPQPGATPATTPTGPPPLSPAGGMGTLAPGGAGWLVTDLPPADYLMLCQVPNRETHKLHYMEGMVKTFTVAN